MSASSKTQTDCSVPKSCSSASSEVTLSNNGAAVNSQGLAFNTVSDLSVVDMTEVEYTHLQHIIYSQMDASATEQDGAGDADLGLAYGVSVPTTQTTHNISQIAVEGESKARTPSPSVYCSDQVKSPDEQYANDSNGSSHQIFQEIKMILVGDAVSDVQMSERTPTSCGEVPGPVLSKARNISDSRTDCRVEASAPLGVRPNPTARVRLEKRFGCIPTEIPKLHISSEQPATLTNLLFNLHHPADLFGITLASEGAKCVKMGHSRLTASEVVYPAHGASVCSSVNGVAQTQNLGSISHVLDPVKDHDISFPRNFSFSYQEDVKPVKTVFCDPVKSKSGDWIKLEGEIPQKAVLPIRRTRAWGHQACPERHTLSDIQNAVGVAETAVTRGRKVVSKGDTTGESSQRRERHNSMERDRRRRIRICCDELNMLVPFCNLETDKATTLQWTTAFLKYIKEIHGDSLKQEFQKAFCGQTGKRIKLVRTSNPGLAYGDPINPHGTQATEQN